MKTILKQSIIDLIERESDMTIATVCPDGQPRATTVSYVNDGFVLYFGTSLNSQKVLNIQNDARISLTINRPYRFWKDIEGLSIDARATHVQSPEEFRKVSQLLFNKYPEVNEFAKADSENVVLMRVDPKRISYLNYRKGFGHVETFIM
jgi:general stress protein 26